MATKTTTKPPPTRVRPELAGMIVDIDTVRPHPDNPRRGDLERLAESLSTHGQYRPIIVQRGTNLIVAGNHTWAAAKSLGWDRIAVTVLDLDDAQARRLMVADNRFSDLGTYDEEGLVALLEVVAAEDGGLLGTGYSESDLALLLQQQDTEEQYGTAVAGKGASERRDTFEAADVHSIVLPYPREEYEAVLANLKTLRSRLGCENFAEVVAAIAADAAAQ